ncbi:MAG: penicillin-binding transpeptidase domain-containing protein [Actinomycetota bacterium]
MIPRIRVLVAVVLVLYGVLFVQLNLTQLARGGELREHPLNTRDLEQDFTGDRGPIVTVDGQVIAVSEEVEGPLERLRIYPDGELYAAVTGYLSLNFGADGLERVWNDELAGDTTRQQLGSLSAVFDTDPRVATVVSTIDSRLQTAARDALGDRRGSVVVLDPATGDVLAMWSFPSYDPNELSSHDLPAVREARERLIADDDDPLRVRAYRETFFPGSTFKIITATAALESGLATTTEPVFEPAAEYVPPLTSRPIRNFGGSTCGGDLVEIFRVSCNTAFAELGVEIGAEQLHSTAEDTGFNDAPPLDLPDPEPSQFPEPSVFEQNTPLLAQAAIGQFDVRATPLQMALVAAGVANRGVVPVPRVVTEVFTDDAVLEDPEPAVWQRAMSATTAATVRDLMATVATEGTAAGLLPPGITGGAKTGTAQLSSETEDTNAWIVGFAPLEAPRLAFAVVVEGGGGTGQQTGGGTAAPIATAVLEAAITAGYLTPAG